MHSNGNDVWKKQWAGLLGGLLLAACGAPDPELPGSPGVAQAPLTWPLYAEYDPTLKTFRCDGLTWNCDAQRKMDGRGQVITEQYAPSTLGGTCVDGNQGYYMDDEWVSKVRLFTADQTPLTQGRPARIQVTVQMPTTPRDNFLDLYASPSVTNPSWTLITTLTPTGTGEQTLETTYTVPVGSRVQAIRAALRRGGSASPCTSGGYDDRDDLVYTPAAPYVSGSKATSVASGRFHSLALRADGTLWGWGDNYYSQLGTEAGPMMTSTLPVQATLLSGVKSVHATSDSSLALRTDGTVWAWGDNSTGVLGNGSTLASATPVQVSGLTGVTALAAGRTHVLARKSDGTVWAWGDNSEGQLGDGTRINRTRPVRVGTLTGVTAIAAGRRHSLVLKSDGTVWTWGDNTMGCLGNGTTNSSSIPIKVAAMAGVTSIAAGDYFSLAIRGTRELWGWGVGPLGDVLGSHHPTPVRTYVWSTGTFSLFAGSTHAVAIDRTLGTPWTWGDLSRCASSTVNYGASPAPISGLTGVSGVSIGELYAQAVLTDGTVWGWGDGRYQRGTDQAGVDSCSPVKAFLP